jgi:HAD superfamily hydrolase (TIGR01509 family)
MIAVTDSAGRTICGDGLVFDLDGVLVDTGRWWSLAERIAVERLGGRPVAIGSEPILGGLAPLVAATELARVTGLTGRETALMAAIDDAAPAVFRQHVQPVPRALAVLDAVAEHVPVAVATNATRIIAEASMAAADITSRTRGLVAADEVAAGKPDPAVYLRACQTIGTDPERTIAVDDTAVGVAAAVNAGMRVIRFGSGQFAANDGALGHIVDWTRVTVSAC